MLHINSLLVNFFYEFLPELFTNGNIYVGLPPKYRYQDSKGKFYYIKNDIELQDFEYNQVKADIKIKNPKNIDLRRLMEIKIAYVRAFTNISYQYSISDKLLSMFLLPPAGTEYLSDIVNQVGLAYNAEDGHVTGIYEEQWHDFYEDEIMNTFLSIESIYEFTELIKFTYKKSTYELYPIDFMRFIDREYNFTYSNFKGLGESSADELFETTIGPDRDLLQLQAGNNDEMNSLLTSLFKSSETNARRDLMRTYLSKDLY